MSYSPTQMTRLRRTPERGAYDRATVHAILDEGFICTVAFTVDGRPYAVPTGYARVGETIYLHGSSGGRIGLRPGAEVCVTVTLLDGLVLARSAFHHSMNYRSVMAFGRTRAITDPAEKDVALEAIVEHIVPGRAATIRGGDRRETAATAVLALDLDEVSAKQRSGPVSDEPEDYGSPAWAGVLPLRLVPGTPEPDEGIEGAPPAHVAAWTRPAPAKG
jgi:nitroimidazol reductase NimA-like FMN-containing flavoprotein (pyridoxamine 5'-phosphate oxidase superfamily)